MAFLPISIIFILFLWVLGFILMESDDLLAGMVSISCYLFPILIVTLPLENIIESNGVLSTGTISFSPTTISQWVLVDVFFLFMALLNEWYIVTAQKKKPAD